MSHDNQKFPDTVQFIKYDDRRWVFMYPEHFYELFEQCIQLKEAFEKSELTENLYEHALKKLINATPELFDAATLLAELQLKNHQIAAARITYITALACARSFIPKRFVPGKHRCEWSFLDNRPFLRLLASYARFLDNQGEILQAIALYEELIFINPNDHQLIRTFLATAYLKVGQPERLLELADRYRNDVNPELALGKILALYQLDEQNQAIKQIKRVAAQQKESIDALLAHNTELDYWQQQGNLWVKIKGALDFLRACLDEILL